MGYREFRLSSEGFARYAEHLHALCADARNSEDFSFGLNTNRMMAAHGVDRLLELAGFDKSDWHTSIASWRPTVLDLGCGSADTTWPPHLLLMLATHGARPQDLVGVDLKPYPSVGLYTHLQANVVKLITQGEFSDFLAPYMPNNGFDVVVINNVGGGIPDPLYSESVSRVQQTRRGFDSILRQAGLSFVKPGGFLIWEPASPSEEQVIWKEPKN